MVAGLLSGNASAVFPSHQANGYIPMRIKDALTIKHRTVVSLKDCHTVADAIAKLAASETGALVVTSGGEPSGLFARSDVMRVSADSPGQSFSTIPLKEATAGYPIWIEPEDNIATAIDMMLGKRIEYLPVREGGKVIAILSLQDLVTCHLEALTAEIEHLNDYIHQLHDSLED